ncbi:hypothetical protein TIFTF001_019100 [Ficus carica]|uniref:Uncharacterized protein n=1 Tax=Ficus carica TaxID=3494 RepID=A0AA88D8K8_FICCA|nr:hypothetical protein TIFTF001_019100 [Ficus carica]
MESWSPFIVFRSGCVCRKDLRISRELECGELLLLHWRSNSYPNAERSPILHSSTSSPLPPPPPPPRPQSPPTPTTKKTTPSPPPPTLPYPPTTATPKPLLAASRNPLRRGYPRERPLPRLPPSPGRLRPPPSKKYGRTSPSSPAEPILLPPPIPAPRRRFRIPTSGTSSTTRTIGPAAGGSRSTTIFAEA